MSGYQTRFFVCNRWADRRFISRWEVQRCVWLLFVRLLEFWGPWSVAAVGDWTVGVLVMGEDLELAGSG